MSNEEYGHGADSEPLPPEIYRRRRMVAILVAALVIALAIWGIVSLVGGAKGSKQAAGSSTVTVASTDTVTTAGGTAPDCTPADLRIQAQVGRPNVAQGNNLPLIMKITNISKAACTAELGAAHQRYEIYTMKTNEPVWKSEICYTSSENRKEVLGSGESRRFTVTWEGTRNNAGGNCTEQAPPVAAGAYQLYTALGSTLGEPTTVNVVPAGEDDSAVGEESEAPAEESQPAAASDKTPKAKKPAPVPAKPKPSASPSPAKPR